MLHSSPKWLKCHKEAVHHKVDGGELRRD